jgi:glycerol-3-phosphate dehydrogenase
MMMMALSQRHGRIIMAVRTTRTTRVDNMPTVVSKPRSFWWSAGGGGGGGGSSSSSSSARSGRAGQYRTHDDGRPWAFRHHATTSASSTKSSSDGLAGPDEDIPSRSEQLERLFLQADRDKDDKNEKEAEPFFDVLVVGGGAVGCGIALDAASRGLHVVCCERGDFASETSSRSTKLIWAGIRYLATSIARLLNQEKSRYLREPHMIWQEFIDEFTMVWHCHRERAYMLNQQRHLTHWMPIAVPFTSYVWAERRDGQPPPFGNALFQLFPGLAPLVFKFYDGMSRFTCPPSYFLGRQAAHAVFPQLRYYDDNNNVDNNVVDGETTTTTTTTTTIMGQRPHIRYLGVFYEAMHNDARTNLAIAMSAARYGAVMCNYTKVMDLIKDDTNGRVTGAIVQDQLTGRICRVFAKRVVLAGGPFTDELRQMEIEASTATTTTTTTKMLPAVRGGGGTHIVVPGTFPMGVLDYNTSDGRFLFILPWLNHTLIGTTDVPGAAQTRHDPPETEINFLLQEASRYLATPLSREDVLSAWRGWRPLAHDPHTAGMNSGGPVSRDHVISEHPTSNVLFIAGGKWTTWREMAQDVVDRIVSNTAKNDVQVIPSCRTLDIVLHGGGYEDASVLRQHLMEAHGLEDDVATHLVDTYGTYVHSVAEYFAEHGTDRIVTGFPYLRAEIPFCCREYACTVEDILSRRTRLAFLNIKAAEAAVEPVADVMSQTLGWSKQVKQVQIEAARDFLKSFGGPEPAA